MSAGSPSLDEPKFSDALRQELEKVGLSEDVYRMILGMAPLRNVIPGYPQVRIEKILVQKYT